MTLQYINTTMQTSVANAAAYTLESPDDLYVGASGRLLGLGTAGYGLVVNGQSSDVILDGLALGYRAGVKLDAASIHLQINGSAEAIGIGVLVEGVSDRVVISASGRVSGDIGVSQEGGGTGLQVFNSGAIDATSDGVRLGDQGRLVNSGTILAAGNGVSVQGDISVFTNTGSIGGGFTGVLMAAGGVLRNAGVISGGIHTTFDNLTPWELKNSGEVIGDIAGGNEVTIVRSSGLIDGPIDTGAGADAVRNTGAITEAVDLGVGNDLYDGRGARERVAVSGADGADTLRGGGADDTLDGGRNADVVVGAGGDDRLTGGKSGDVFAFRGEVGDDLITDFNADEDVIEFAKAIFKTFGKLQPAMDQVGADVVITISADDSITLQNVSLAALTAADFSFVA